MLAIDAHICMVRLANICSASEATNEQSEIFRKALRVKIHSLTYRKQNACQIFQRNLDKLREKYIRRSPYIERYHNTL